MPGTAIIVPCRLDSSRFPRKLLHKIKGKALLLWVAERIAAAAPEYPLYFAVDHELLRSCVVEGGFRAILTRSDHQSGTDRIAEANEAVGADRVINVQADEPLVSAGQIALLGSLIGESAPMATLATPFKTGADYLNPNQVKVVRDLEGRALYFSRAPIPYSRDAKGPVDDAWVRAHSCLRHLGLYAYKADLLRRFAKLPVGKLEAVEKLEQLRALENGYEIDVGLTDDPTIGVDTLEDAEAFERVLEAGA
jgi:3-deoxy-manno-octulosonate cytidylyltransferase (CMP-KDO synthetase)